MKSKPFTPNAAATELSDQALLGVLGGCDNSPTGGTSNGDLVTAETVSSAAHAPANSAGGRSNANNANDDHSSAGTSTPVPHGPNGAGEREPATGTASGSGERVPTTTDTRTAPTGTATTPPGSTTQPHAPSSGDAGHTGPNDRSGHNDHESRFDEAFDEIHDGYHQMIDGAKDLAHAWIDSLPEHGPIGAGFHFFSRLHDRDHGHR